MRKFIFGLVAAVMMTACGFSGSTNAVDSTDSLSTDTVEVVDSLAADSVAMDSVAE